MNRQLDEIERWLRPKKEGSRLEYLIEQEHVRLDTRNKKLMNVLKLIRRNAFYRVMEPFRELCDNYRDGHALSHNLTRVHGALIERPGEVGVLLCPTANYSPKVATIMSKFLEGLNAAVRSSPAGPNPRLRFRLAQNAGIQLAIVSAQNSAFY